MSRIPVLSSAELAAFNLPDGSFRVPSRSVRVLDGDTIKLMTGRRGPLGAELVALRIRFRSIAAPETRKSRWTDRPLEALGADPNGSCPGRAARETLIRFVKGRDLIISHNRIFDPHGRLLADVSVVPDRTAPDEAALSLERVMLARGVVTRFRAEPLPPLHPFGDNLLPSP
jgi:endonuclease YncB( thermonuclease family)